MNTLLRVCLILVFINVIYNASLHCWYTTRNKRFLLKNFAVVMLSNLAFVTAKVKRKLLSHFFFLIPMAEAPFLVLHFSYVICNIAICNIVAMSGLVHLAATWKCYINYKHRYVGLLVIQLLPLLNSLMNVGM